jgi:hypothetical protein
LRAHHVGEVVDECLSRRMPAQVNCHGSSFWREGEPPVAPGSGGRNDPRKEKTNRVAQGDLKGAIHPYLCLHGSRRSSCLGGIETRGYRGVGSASVMKWGYAAHVAKGCCRVGCSVPGRICGSKPNQPAPQQALSHAVFATGRSTLHPLLSEMLVPGRCCP